MTVIKDERSLNYLCFCNYTSKNETGILWLYPVDMVQTSGISLSRGRFDIP